MRLILYVPCSNFACSSGFIRVRLTSLICFLFNVNNPAGIIKIGQASFNHSILYSKQSHSILMIIFEYSHFLFLFCPSLRQFSNKSYLGYYWCICHNFKEYITAKLFYLDFAVNLSISSIFWDQLVWSLINIVSICLFSSCRWFRLLWLVSLTVIKKLKFFNALIVHFN